jgi:hypothetical protein
VKRLFPVLVIGISLLLIGIITSCSPPSLYSEKDAIEVTAQELFSSYEEDGVAADTLYKDNLLKVTGVIYYVGTDYIFEAPEVVISGGGENEARGIDCIFDTRYESQVAKLEVGQTVAVMGICDGYLENVLLLDCQPCEE